MKITVRKDDIVVEGDDGWLTPEMKKEIFKKLESRRDAIDLEWFDLAFLGEKRIAKVK